MLAMGETPGSKLCKKHSGVPSAKQSQSWVTGSVEVRVSDGALTEK